MTTPPSRFVPIENAEARLQRIWLRVAERTEGAHARSTFVRRKFWAVAASAVLVATATLLWVWPQSVEQSAWEQAVLETAGDSLAVDLKDGSRLELAANTRLEVTDGKDEAIRIALERGRVACDVSHRPKRPFSVIARDVEVRVTGTRFSVQLSEADARLSVEVERGSVEVLRRSDATMLQRLGAGERWLSALSVSSRSDKQEVLAPKAEASGVSEEFAEGSDTPHETAQAPSDKPREVNSEAPSSRVVPTPAVADDTNENEEAELERDAKALLERANTLRRNGDAAGAARAYERLLADYPKDARVGLAAFELGRLRMDRLSDLSGAIRALKRAVTAAPGAGFREDAMARLVQAYHAQGAKAQCRRARDAYLASYPSGVHAIAVSKRCSP